MTDRNNQVEALEFTIEEHQQETFMLNEEINYLIANRPVARRKCFDNVLCFIKKKTVKKLIHTTLFDVNIGSLKNTSDGLKVVIQTWRWLTDVMIQMPFIDGVDLSVK